MSIVTNAFFVSGMPHVLLAPDRSPGWQSLHESFARVRADIERSDADLILYFSTQWLSVIGYLFQANPNPVWTHVDMDWHELGSIPYDFKIDAAFAPYYAEQVRERYGYHTALVNYHGFPIDTGTVVAQKLLNPENRLPAAMVSCNMYAEQNEIMQIGNAGAHALRESGKKAVVVVVSNLSNRFHVAEIDPAHDRISSAKDDEWNRKICELLSEGRLEDVSQCARDAAREANGDMGFRGVWWLNGLCGQGNHFEGEVYDYQPVWGTGGALIRLTPTSPIEPTSYLELEAEDRVIAAATVHDPYLKRAPRLEDAADTSQANEVAGVEAAPLETDSAAGRKIKTSAAPPPVGAYPHARQEGQLLFLSGIGPRKVGTSEIPGVTFGPTGEVVEWDIAIQTRSVIENVKTILEASGSCLEKVIDIQVFLTHMKRDFAGFNKVYAEYFADIGATRTTVEVTSLPTPIAVEFKIIAKM